MLLANAMVELARIAGPVGAILVVASFVLRKYLSRELVKLFPKLTQEQAYRLLLGVLWALTVLTLAAMGTWLAAYYKPSPTVSVTGRITLDGMPPAVDSVSVQLEVEGSRSALAVTNGGDFATSMSAGTTAKLVIDFRDYDPHAIDISGESIFLPLDFRTPTWRGNGILLRASRTETMLSAASDIDELMEEARTAYPFDTPLGRSYNLAKFGRLYERLKKKPVRLLTTAAKFYVYALLARSEVILAACLCLDGNRWDATLGGYTSACETHARRALRIGAVVQQRALAHDPEMMKVVNRTAFEAAREHCRDALVSCYCVEGQYSNEPEAARFAALALMEAERAFPEVVARARQAGDPIVLEQKRKNEVSPPHPAADAGAFDSSVLLLYRTGRDAESAWEIAEVAVWQPRLLASVVIAGVDRNTDWLQSLREFVVLGDTVNTKSPLVSRFEPNAGPVQLDESPLVNSIDAIQREFGSQPNADNGAKPGVRFE